MSIPPSGTLTGIKSNTSGIKSNTSGIKSNTSGMTDTRVSDASLKTNKEKEKSNSTSEIVASPVKNNINKKDAKEAIEQIDAKGNADILNKSLETQIAREGGLTEDTKKDLIEKEDIRNKTMDLLTSSLKASNRNNSINLNKGGRKRRKTLKRK